MKIFSRRNKISEYFKNISCMKQDVYENTMETFNLMKDILKDLVNQYKDEITQKDPRISIKFKNKSNFKAQVKLGSDTLILLMHTNVFKLPKDNFVYKTSYFKEDPLRSYCGVIYIYDFLSDSFKYNRYNDLGYLICRIFVNKDKHYMVEGKGKICVGNNDISTNIINEENMINLVEEVVLSSLNFELLVPPFVESQLIKTENIIQLAETNNLLKTGKRLGFRFSWEDD